MSEAASHILIDRDTLTTLTSVAESALLELQDGLNDGLYDQDAIAGIAADKVENAIAIAKGAAA